MNLQILLPSGVLLDAPCQRVVAEGLSGWFCLLPRHTDIAVALVPGVLEWTPTGTKLPSWVAVDRGVLVKQGPLVTVTSRRAVSSGNLEELRAMVDAEFRHVDEVEERARSVAARLEASFVRKFLRSREADHV